MCKNPLLNPRFTSVFSSRSLFYGLSWAHSSILSQFFYMVWGRVPTLFFICRNSVVSVLFVDETVLSPLNRFGAVAKNQLDIISLFVDSQFYSVGVYDNLSLSFASMLASHWCLGSCVGQLGVTFNFIFFQLTADDLIDKSHVPWFIWTFQVRLRKQVRGLVEIVLLPRCTQARPVSLVWGEGWVSK